MPRRFLIVIVAAIVASPARASSFDPAQMPTLREGARGAAVLTLQSALNEWRAARGRATIAVDGDFGPQTRGAVLSFQWANALYPDAVVGPRTWRALALATGGGGARSAEAARQEAAWARAAMPGRFSVTDLPANGWRPVAVWLPAGFDAALPARALVYFHGHGGNVGEALAQNGVLARLCDLGARHPQTVFICPQAAAAPFSYWMRPGSGESLARLEREALAEAARLAGAAGPAAIDVEARIVSAHSGGGLALRNAVLAGEMRADFVELLDAAYGDWAQTIAAWAALQPAAARPLIEGWHTPGATRTNDLDIARRYPAFVTVHDSAVAHGAVPARYLGTALGY